MSRIQIRYTKSKRSGLNDPFAIFEFEVYNEKDFEEVLKNIEEHFDGVVIECDSMERNIPPRKKRKAKGKKHGYTKPFATSI